MQFHFTDLKFLILPQFFIAAQKNYDFTLIFKTWAGGNCPLPPRKVRQCREVSSESIVLSQNLVFQELQSRGKLFLEPNEINTASLQRRLFVLRSSTGLFAFPSKVETIIIYKPASKAKLNLFSLFVLLCQKKKRYKMYGVSSSVNYLLLFFEINH